MHGEKFIDPFINLVEKNFDSTFHIYLILKSDKYPIQARSNIYTISEQASFFAKISFYIGRLYSAEKIIFHGLFHKELLLLLFFQPWLLKKSYLVVWGAELYLHLRRKPGLKSIVYGIFHRAALKRIGHFVTYVKGDYELAQKWYGAKGKYHECLMYSSNLFKDYAVPPKQGDTINILVGNSATQTNNHAQIFDKLMQYKDKDIQIYCPLSYGLADYAEQTAKLGKKIFGDKFIPLLDFMPFDKYLELLGQIDIAVFAHKRQQAMGNTITLLGLGKKVYMRSDVTSWGLLSAIGVSVFDIDCFDIIPMPADEMSFNKKIISEYFSEKKLIEQLELIFNDM